jgi:hypothetical protein
MFPDLNILENVWPIMSSKVCDGKQFENEEKLWSTITIVEDEINIKSKEDIKKLFDKYGKRLIVLKKSKVAQIYYSE